MEPGELPRGPGCAWPAQAFRAARGLLLALAFAASEQLWRRRIESSVEALRELARSGVRLGVVSNAEGTVEALRAARGEHQLPTAPVFRCVPSTVRLREDLAAAGIPYETGAGVLDFHALRVTYATMLARAGVSLVQAQQLMRHSDPKLTANVYTRLELHDGHAAVARIDVAATPAAGAARPSGTAR